MKQLYNARAGLSSVFAEKRAAARRSSKITRDNAGKSPDGLDNPAALC